MCLRRVKELILLNFINVIFVEATISQQPAQALLLYYYIARKRGKAMYQTPPGYCYSMCIPPPRHQPTRRVYTPKLYQLLCLHIYYFNLSRVRFNVFCCYIVYTIPTLYYTLCAVDKNVFVIVSLLSNQPPHYCVEKIKNKKQQVNI